MGFTRLFFSFRHSEATLQNMCVHFPMIPHLTLLLFGSLEPVTQPTPSPSKYEGYLKICMAFSEGNSTKILVESVDNWGIDTVCLAVPESLS